MLIAEKPSQYQLKNSIERITCNHLNTKSKNMKKKRFDPQKSFFELGIVRWTGGLALSVAIASTLMIIAFSELTGDATYNGFNHAITVFKFPIGVLATLIPIIALLATNHRSEQTKEQIKLALDNNNFTNYFKHLSEFESYIEKHKTKSDIKFKSLRNLHKLIFPQSKKGNFRVSGELISEITTVIKEAVKYANTIENIRSEAIEIEENHKPLKAPLVHKETKIARRIDEINEKIKTRKNRPRISDLSNPNDLNDELEKNEKELLTEKSKLENIQREINTINKIIDSMIEPKRKEIGEKTQKLKETANQVINKAKIKKIYKFQISSGKTEEQEIELITEETKNLSEILEAMATSIQALDMALQFDEEYETPKNIDKFIELFETINESMTSKYKHSLEKYTAEVINSGK